METRLQKWQIALAQTSQFSRIRRETPHSHRAIYTSHALRSENPLDFCVAALALVHSTAEHAAPVLVNSCHMKVIDTVLNDTLRLISGTMPPTLLPMPPVIASIPPAAIRSEHFLLKLAEKVERPGMQPSTKHLRRRLLPLATNAVCDACKCLVRKSRNSAMGPNFYVSAPSTFVTEFSNILESLNIKLVATSRSLSHVCSLILLILERYRVESTVPWTHISP